MTIGSTELLALSPLLVTVATAVVVMLSVAWRRHHFLNATLTVVGDGQDRASFEQRGRDLLDAGRIRMAGALDKEGAYAAYRDADIVLGDDLAGSITVSPVDTDLLAR